MEKQVQLLPGTIKALNRKRGELELTKRELAKKIGNSENTLYRWATKIPPFKVQTKVYKKESYGESVLE